MIDLESYRWDQLQTPTGTASEVPKLIRAFQDSPSETTFRAVFDKLTGEGDIAISSAFLAAFPLIVTTIGRLGPSDRIAFCCELSWAVALTASANQSMFPADALDEYSTGLEQFRALLADTMLSAPDAVTLRYLLAGMAATAGDYQVALGLIHAEIVLSCPHCCAFLTCESCGRAMQAWPDFF